MIINHWQCSIYKVKEFSVCLGMWEVWCNLPMYRWAPGPFRHHLFWCLFVSAGNWLPHTIWHPAAKGSGIAMASQLQSFLGKKCCKIWDFLRWSIRGLTSWAPYDAENGPITCTGPTGPTGSTGPTGPYGPYGPLRTLRALYGPIRALRDLRAPGKSPETDLTWILPGFFGTCWSHFPFPPATGRTKFAMGKSWKCYVALRHFTAPN